jgi:hypothetical protein
MSRAQKKRRTESPVTVENPELTAVEKVVAGFILPDNRKHEKKVLEALDNPTPTGIFNVDVADITALSERELGDVETSLKAAAGKHDTIGTRRPLKLSELNHRLVEFTGIFENLERELEEARDAFFAAAGEDAVEPDPVDNPHASLWYHFKMAEVRLGQARVHVSEIRRALGLKKAMDTRFAEPKIKSIEESKTDLTVIVGATLTTLRIERRKLERASSFPELETKFKNLQKLARDKTDVDIVQGYFTPVDKLLKELRDRQFPTAKARTREWLDTKIGVRRQLKTRHEEDIVAWLARANALCDDLPDNTHEKVAMLSKIPTSNTKHTAELSKHDKKIDKLECEKKLYIDPLLPRVNDTLLSKMAMVAVLKPADGVQVGVYEVFRSKTDCPKDADGHEIHYEGFPSPTFDNLKQKFAKKQSDAGNDVYDETSNKMFKYSDSAIGCDRKKAFAMSHEWLKEASDSAPKKPEQTDFILATPE